MKVVPVCPRCRTRLAGAILEVARRVGLVTFERLRCPVCGAGAFRLVAS